MCAGEREKESLSSVSALTILKPSSSSSSSSSRVYTYIYIIRVRIPPSTHLITTLMVNSAETPPHPSRTIEDSRVAFFSTRPARNFHPSRPKRTAFDRMSVKTICLPSPSFLLSSLVAKGERRERVEWVWTNKRGAMERERGSTL